VFGAAASSIIFYNNKTKDLRFKTPLPSLEVVSLYQMREINVCEADKEKNIKICAKVTVIPAPKLSFELPTMTLASMNSVGESFVEFSKPMDSRTLQ
jgi:hypothetical protein